jgi:hypothetical protein
MRYDAATAKLVEEDYASVPALEVFKDDLQHGHSKIVIYRYRS